MSASRDVRTPNVRAGVAVVSACGAISGAYDEQAGEWLECEGGCGTEWRIHLELDGDALPVAEGPHEQVEFRHAFASAPSTRRHTELLMRSVKADAQLAVSESFAYQGRLPGAAWAQVCWPGTGPGLRLLAICRNPLDADGQPLLFDRGAYRDLIAES